MTTEEMIALAQKKAKESKALKKTLVEKLSIEAHRDWVKNYIRSCRFYKVTKEQCRKDCEQKPPFDPLTFELLWMNDCLRYPDKKIIGFPTA